MTKINPMSKSLKGGIHLMQKQKQKKHAKKIKIVLIISKKK